MSFTFTHPAHLSHLAKYTSPAALTLVGGDEHDPHSVPVYDEKKSAPVLYLPPLLSSLPATFPSTPFHSENPPLVTETRLPDIDPASLSLHKALHYFRPRDENYARQSFLWPGESSSQPSSRPPIQRGVQLGPNGPPRARGARLVLRGVP